MREILWHINISVKNCVIFTTLVYTDSPLSCECVCNTVGLVLAEWQLDELKPTLGCMQNDRFCLCLNCSPCVRSRSDLTICELMSS